MVPLEKEAVYVQMHSGPHTMREIVRMWMYGVIDPEAYYWHEQLEKWEPLAALMAAEGVTNGRIAAAEVPATTSQADERSGGRDILLQRGAKEPSNLQTSVQPNEQDELAA